MQVKVKDHVTYCPVLLIKTTHNKVTPLTCHHWIIFSFLCQNIFFPFFVTLKISHSLFSLFSLRFFIFFKQSNIFHHFHAGQTKAETDWLYCPCSLFGSFLWATRFLRWGLNTRYVIWCLWLWMWLLDFVIVNPNTTPPTQLNYD